MILNRNYDGICWWCGKIADSKEHKIKRTDFINVFGNGPFQDPNSRPVAVRDNKEIPIQSPKSDFLKFKNSLCKLCNGTRSAKFDKDYSIFSNYIRRNVNSIQKNLIIDFKEIFGDEWSVGMRNTFKYWVKHIACRVAEFGFGVSDNLINFLNGAEGLIDVNFLFQFREYNLRLSEGMKADRNASNFEHLFLGPVRNYKRLLIRLDANECITGWYTLNWFSVNYLYQDSIQTQIYQDENPFDCSILLLNPVWVKNAPSMQSLKSSKEAIEKLEMYDRGETVFEGEEFRGRLMKQKYTLCNKP